MPYDHFHGPSDPFAHHLRNMVFHLAGFKIPRSIRMLTQFGGDALLPSIVKGRYIAPLVSKRVAADIRKRALIEGTFGEFVANEGGWDPKWDVPRTMHILRPFRGHLRERTREARATKITNAMTGMPDRLAKYEQEMEDRKPKKDLYNLFARAKRVADRKR